MGLVKASVGAASGALGDQWKEYFYCDTLKDGILVAKGQKRTTKKSSNTKGMENIITNGSLVAVNEGQCMMIVDQGKIVEVCAEAGEFIYDTSSEPTIFQGGLGKGILDTFKTIGRRTTFGGDTAKDQRVYYFNTKEVTGNKFGTASPIPFRVVDKNVNLDVDISIRCNGEYSYRMTDPLLFYTNVCGNVTEEFTREEIDSMLKAELSTALQPAFAKISEMGVRYSALPAHTQEIADALNEILSEKWGKLRGLQVYSMAINSVTASKEDEEMIKELQKTQAYADSSRLAATMGMAQAEAMKAAASNTATGPMFAFAGMNMAAQTGGMDANTLMAMGQAERQAAARGAQAGEPAAPQPQAGGTAAPQPQAGWTCSCGSVNHGKFCSNCGSQRPDVGWTCTCGTQNKGNFCSECGSPKP
jgi:membrane protease subunit (stomatin/prohibitin family)